MFNVLNQPKGSTIGLLSDGRTVQQFYDDVTAAIKRTPKFITPEQFGAVGNDATKDTAGWLAAIAESQATGSYIVPAAGVNYISNVAWQLVHPTTFKIARIAGPGRNVCSVTFVGGSAGTPAISIKGRDHTAGNGAAMGCICYGFELRGADWLGDGVLWENVGLWSLLADMRILQCAGDGLVSIGSFDNAIKSVEARANGGFGVRCYEPKATDVGGFREQSFMRFEDVHSLSNNGYGVQWLIDGGNSYTFSKPKASEGTVGFQIERGIGMSITDLYCDGTTKVAGSTNVGIRMNGGENIFIYGGRQWNVKYGVQVVGGGFAFVGPYSLAFDSPAGSDVYDLYATSGASYTKPITPMGLVRILDESDYALVRGSSQKPITYSATIASATLGTGSAAVTTYTDNNKKVNLSLKFTLGANPVIPTYPTVTLPTNRPGSPASGPLRVVLRKATTNRVYVGAGIVSSDGLGVTLLFNTDNGAPPAAYGAGDILYIDGEYRRA